MTFEILAEEMLHFLVFRDVTHCQMLNFYRYLKVLHGFIFGFNYLFLLTD